MNNKIRIQPRILTGNKTKLDELAADYGLNREAFIKKIATEQFVLPDKNSFMWFKLAGTKPPFERDDIKEMIPVEITNWNTERYSVEVTAETERALLFKAYDNSCTGKFAIADLLNKICINGAIFIQKELIDYFAIKNGGVE